MKVTWLRAHGQVSLCSRQSHGRGSKWVARYECKCALTGAQKGSESSSLAWGPVSSPRGRTE
eukprot:3440453-Rhodomonas_salina.1